MKTVIVLEDGKYEISHENGTNFEALRYGKEWWDLTGDKMILSLCQRIEDLEEELFELEQGGYI